MPIQIEHGIPETKAVNIWITSENLTSRVGLSFGALFVLIKPSEARELAAALSEAADQATGNGVSHEKNREDVRLVDGAD